MQINVRYAPLTTRRYSINEANEYLRDCYGLIFSGVVKHSYGNGGNTQVAKGVRIEMVN